MGVPPAVLEGVQIGAPLVGSALQARGLREDASATAAAARHNARLARIEGRAEAARLRRRGRFELARQRVQVGAGDVLAEGSPLDVLAANAAEIEREAVDATIAGRNTARLEEGRAQTALAAGRRRGAASLLSGSLQALETGYRIRPDWFGGR